MKNLVFNKTGLETKQAIQTRIVALGQRLERRNEVLERFMQDTKKLRSYLIRIAEISYSVYSTKTAAIYSSHDISSEQKEEISQLCTRIFEIEQEINHLKLIAANLPDDQQIELSYEELVRFGFGSSTGLEAEA
jgi:hypothetical protein